VDVFLQHGGGICYPYDSQTGAIIIGDNVMQMFLQFGHGMMAHTRELLSAWKSGAAILSPRDLTEPQLKKVAADIKKTGAEPLLDPQCFSTKADHYRLTKHTYWGVISQYPNEVFLGGIRTAELLAALADLDRSLGIGRHILPGPLAGVVNDDYFSACEAIIDEAPNHFGADPILITIALSNAVMLDELQIENLIERARNWTSLAGFYLVAETPGAYLVDNPVWLANLLILASGLKLLGKSIVVGYSNHQMLCLAAARVDAIAAGTWLNVRAFPPDKFFTPTEEEISRRSTWYYCPQTLSEYKLPSLDLALTAGLLNLMRPDPALGSQYADPLFQGLPPSTVNWGEQDAFRHYLTCVRAQALRIPQTSFVDAYDDLTRALDAAELLLKVLRRDGVFGQDRDFFPFLDVNRAALARFRAARGQQLQRSW
jgi:hypothetical protein